MAVPSVQFEGVSKQFHLGAHYRSLGGLVSSLWRKCRGVTPAETGTSNSFWALRDVSFTVAPGDALGIIGPNGAGKSTALKLLAHILTPDSGSIAVRGRMAALIEVGAGFHGDLTGRENVYLNGSILGMSRVEVRAKLDDIVAFAGLEQFLDMPVKRYSSGMYARLGFSIAAHVEPDVLLVDEVLSVGDAMFRLRCMERMKQLADAGTTLVFVTHDLDQMNTVCPRAIVLEKGVAVFDGDSREAVAQYISAMSRSHMGNKTDIQTTPSNRKSVEVVGVRFLDTANQEMIWATPGKPVRILVTLRFHQRMPRFVLELNMRGSVGNKLVSINSGRDGLALPCGIGEQTIELALANLPVCGGQYFWNVRLWNADTGSNEIDSSFRFPLMVDDRGLATGTLALDHDWILCRDASGDNLTPSQKSKDQGVCVTKESHEDMYS